MRVHTLPLDQLVCFLLGVSVWVLESPLSKLRHQRVCETNNMASLSRSACFSWQSDCRSGFSCILDDSETSPCTVIKDEFPGPVEKTPQFSSDRLDFIMRWKDTSAAGKKNPRTLLLTKAVKYYMLQCSGSRGKGGCCWVSDFPCSICSLRTNNCEEMEGDL